MLRMSQLASLAWLGVAIGCTDGVGPRIGTCKPSDGIALTLAVAQYATVNPTADSACMRFAANAGADTAEYLIVPQTATGVPGTLMLFSLNGDTLAPTPSLTRAQVQALSPAQRFHATLRLGEETRWQWLNPQTAPPPSPGGPALARAPAAQAGPPAYNSLRQFRVCATLTCASFDAVTARALAVGNKVAVYVDTTAPAGGLDSASLDSLAATFDTRLYPLDTAAFGRESDIDTNTVVLVLMTPVVNKLIASADCATTGYVAGFFLGVDLDPLFRTDARSNKGEVFYSIVPDPSGTLSCAHSTDQVKRIVPVTFVHEFQHMISFNQHVLLRGGAAEVLWLNEGFSHYAEELGGRSYGVGTPEFSRFTVGDVFNAYKYLDSSAFHFLLPTAGIGSLEERGAAWLFVRYLVDQNATDTTLTSWHVFTRKMLQTSLTGATNIATQTGAPFARTVTRWALANFVSDLPSFTAPPELRYKSWLFRTTYAGLHAQDSVAFKKAFPLTPTTSDADAVDFSGTLRAGSGIYHRAFQAAGGGPFALRFIAPNGFPLPRDYVPRLNVIRIR
jgi:hypothetical protein